MLIAIIAAMEEETAPLKSQLQNIHTETIAGFEFSRGQMSGKDVILLKSGVGKVNAAIGASLLLYRFKPDYVINTGSAGGFDSSLNIGDLVIGETLCYHDVDLTAFGYEPGQLPELPAVFSSDKKLVDLTIKHLNAIAHIKYRAGLIISGDTFIHEPENIDKLRLEFPGVIACEMEAASIAQTCLLFKVPFVVIRAVSDIPGRENAIAFKQFLAQAAENYTLFLLSMIQGNE